MVEEQKRKIRWKIPLLITICSLSFPAYARYAGGSGTATYPYQVSTVTDLIALGENPQDYDKHFILTTDIDLDPNLPGRKVFDKAVIAPDTDTVKSGYQGIPFTGVFDGNGNTISHLTITGGSYLGLFGQLGREAKIKNLGVVDVSITGSSGYVGGLIGSNGGIWWSDDSSVIDCYSTGEVNGSDYVGGLVGNNGGDVAGCYSSSEVSGDSWIGGLLGTNRGDVTYCYSTGNVSGSFFVGGLVGYNFGRVTVCFWDMETSGQSISNAGTGKTSSEMHMSVTFHSWGIWNNQSNKVWTIDEGNDYPRLWWENKSGNVIKPTFATNPNPIDGDLHEDTWVSLNWKAGGAAISHDVYFGDNFNDVQAGTTETFHGNQSSTFYVVGITGFAYPDGLVPGATYYWRIDEVNDNGPNSPWKGDVWNFSIAPRTAYNPDPTDGAESVYLNVELSWTPGFGAKLHTVYFGDNFEDVDNATDGPDQGAITYNPDTLKMAKTYYWRVDEFDGVETHKGEVWSFITQGAVSRPKPGNGAVDVTQTPVLKWTPGIYADSYQVYFGTDKEAVKKADTDSPEYKGEGNLGFERYIPGRLSMTTTYYWRIDEFNNANSDSPLTGPVWSFATADFIIVDEFESYNDLDPADPASKRVFNTWIDGFDTPKTNGSAVGSYDLYGPLNPTSIVHSGLQSMWYSYDNSVGMSEATANTADLAIGRDWTIEDVVVLSLWFRGNLANTPEPMYVALANRSNPPEVVYHDYPNATQITPWMEWRIDLQELAVQSVDLTNINTISIGFGNKNNPQAGGEGEMWFDDIRLYRPASQEPAL
jgi:hypothetical protein